MSWLPCRLRGGFLKGVRTERGRHGGSTRQTSAGGSRRDGSSRPRRYDRESRVFVGRCRPTLRLRGGANVRRVQRTLQTPTGTVQLMVKDSMASYYIAQFLFDDIKSVLIDGQPLLGESVLWEITEGGTGTSLAFRMGGVRSVGAKLPIPGAFTMAPGWRMEGLISPVIPSSVLMFFTYMGSRATDASGELIVTSAAPLRGNLSVNLGLDSGVDVHLAGQLRLSYAALPPGCEEG